MSAEVGAMQPHARIPRHVAVVMDGNGRWAAKRGLPRLMGHRKGTDSVKACVRAAAQAGVKHLTLFAFSSENWNRPADEVAGLMKLFITSLEKETAELHKAGIRIRLIGGLERFSEALRDKIAAVHALTADNSVMTLNICVNYGSRWEIVQACRKAASSVTSPEEITEALLGQCLQIPDAGDVDLLIRTSGEQRISNFLLWQIAYAELIFSPVLWPDFGEKEFAAALEEYALRERRFGRTSEQLEKEKPC